MSRRSSLSVLALALAVLARATGGAQPLPPPQPRVLRPLVTAADIIDTQPLSVAPPFVHWDLRAFAGCSVPWQVGPFVPDLDGNGRPNELPDRQRATAEFAAAFDAWSRVTPAVIHFIRGTDAVPPPPVGQVFAGLQLDGHNSLTFVSQRFAPDDVYDQPGYAFGGMVAARAVIVQPGPNLRLETTPGGDDLISRRAVGGQFVDLIVDGGDRIISTTPGNQGGLGGGLLALTGLFFDRRTGVLREADIIFDAGIAWVLGTAPNQQAPQQINLRGTAMHEIGHWVGIGHANVPAGTAAILTPTMARSVVPFFGTSDNVTLEAADTDSINFLYTPDLGDAPDPLVATEGVYPTRDHTSLRSGVTLNGVRLMRPGVGPAHLFGFFAAARQYQYEWLGDQLDDAVTECGPNRVDRFDDGVTFGAFRPGGPAVPVTITVSTGRDTEGRTHAYTAGAAGTPLLLNAWFDWNANGVWEAAEQVVTNREVVPAPPAGAAPVRTVVAVPVAAPAGAVRGGWARVRLDYRAHAAAVGDVPPSPPGPTDVAQFGEVEDHSITYAPPTGATSFLGFPHDPVSPKLVERGVPRFDVRPDPIGAAEATLAVAGLDGSLRGLLQRLLSLPRLLSPAEVIAQDVGAPSLLTVVVTEGQSQFERLTVRFATLRATGALGRVTPTPTDADSVTVAAGEPVVLEIFPGRVLDGRRRAGSLLDARGFDGVAPSFQRIVLEEHVANAEVQPGTVRDAGLLLDQRIEIVPTDLPFCPFPAGKRRIPGDLIVAAGAGLCLGGPKHLIEPDAFYVNPDATWTASGARTIEVRTFVGDLTVDGSADLAVTDDVTLRGLFGRVDLRGPTRVAAGDRVQVIGARDGITLGVAREPADDDIFPTDVRAPRIDLTARGADGAIVLESARLAGRFITIDTRASLSRVGEKGVVVGFASLLTTDPADTGDPAGTGDIRIESTGDVRIERRARLDASRNIRIATRRPSDRLCLEGGVVLEANDGAGRIDLSGVQGGVYDDGTTTFHGVVMGDVRQGFCPPHADAGAPSTTLPPATSTTVMPTTTTTVAGSVVDVPFRFYVRIVSSDGGASSVDVPRRSSEPPVVVAIGDGAVSAFPVGRRVTGADIAALGDDTLARLVTAAGAYLAAHPGDYPGYASVIELRWAARD